MLRNSLKEVSRQSIFTPKTDNTSISWHNSLFSVCTPKDLHVFEFSYDLKCVDKRLDFVESIIQTPKLSPATYLTSNNFIRFGVSNFEISQLIVDPSLWPHNSHIVQEMACIIDCKWLPDGFCFNGEPLLAVLNNIGNVNIFGKNKRSWESLLDLSECVNKELHLELPNCVQDLKIKADAVESSAMCFAPTSKNESCYIAMGQKNGSILLWSLHMEKKIKLQAAYQSCIKSDSNEVKSILWIDKGNENFLLVVSNIVGQIFLYDCIVNRNIKVLKTHFIWPQKDKMIAQCLCHTYINNKLILFFNKHRHFVVVMLDKDYKVISQFAEVVNDYKICSIAVNLNEMILGTANFQLYRITIDVINENLDVRYDLIEIKDTYNNYELHDLSFSKNNQVIAGVVVDRSVNNRIKSSCINIILFSNDSNTDNMSYLLDNKVQSIINLWDAIELLRLKIVKSKSLPTTELNNIITDGNIDLYKLKLYLVVATIWCNLEYNLKVPRGLLPKNIEFVKEKIMLKHAQSQLHELQKSISHNNITDFDKEMFIGTKRYLIYYSRKYNVALENLVSLTLYNSVECESKYICQCCDNVIEGFSCSSGHINMFCPISFLPIETSDYLTCVVCKITVRFELYHKQTKCIFCDRYLQKYL
ncbi:uncharacterized protein LOC132903211 [Amyelois transitella]|uniref:uncharacterized protein LOC132903211 n=1 Tax=Amyelois transitella TaxID=680683 RepID=UPI0029906602|nr:uncharacterized protein LOC132903211 [Amyelois transitella]